MNAEEILPRTAIFRHKEGGLAFFADYFRFELLRRRGGWWVDMDMICIRPLDFAAPVVFVDYARTSLQNAILKFSCGHPLAAALADAYSDVNRILPWDKPSTKYQKLRRRLMFWRDSRCYIRGRDAGGMSGLKLAVRHFGLEAYIQPGAVIWNKHKAMESAGWNIDKVLSLPPDLRCLHLHNSNYVVDGIDKDGDYPADSLYEVLKRRYPEP